MGKPTKAEFDTAMAEAVRLRESGEDNHYVAKTLLNLDYRHRKLEQVYHALEHFIHSGMAETEHIKLTLAMRRYEEANRRTGDEGNHLLT